MSNAEKYSNMHWYDLFPRMHYYKDDAFIYFIPISFLMKNNELPNHIKIIENQDQYLINLDAIKYDDKTINQYFRNRTKKEKIKINKLFNYCKFLYYESTGAKDLYDKKIEQSERQFCTEYRKFKKNFFKVDCEEVKKLLDTPDVFKIFILYRSVKINHCDCPLDYKKEFLPSTARACGMDDIFLDEKDTISVVPLDGVLRSPNEDIIKKLYALLWTNSSCDEGEYDAVLEYIHVLEECTFYIINGAVQKQFIKNIVYKSIDKNGKFIFDTEKAMKQLSERYDDISAISEDEMEDCLKRYNKRLSLYAYFIIKIYIKNKIKYLKWYSRRLEFNENDDCLFKGGDDLKKIEGAVSKIKIESKEDFLDLFNNDKSKISKDNQKMILDFIFQSDKSKTATKNVLGAKREKTAKRRWIEKNYFFIHLLHAQYISACGYAGVPEPDESMLCYRLIIACYLFFHLKKKEIKKLEGKNFMSTKFDDRNKTIGGLYYQMKKDDYSAEKEGAWKSFFYYNSMMGCLFSRYYNMFSLGNKLDYSMEEMVFNLHQKTIIKVWNQGLEKAQKYTNFTPEI